MSVTLLIQLLQALAATMAEAAPLVAQGRAVLDASDAAQVHAALQQAEAATAGLRAEVDAALAAAASR
jgi:hypothetical protein